MDFMTVQEAAQALRISSRTLKALLEAGEIPFTRCGERTIRIPRQTLAEWIARGGAPAPMARDSSPAPTP